MGYKRGCVARVRLADIAKVGQGTWILGLDSALAYHGLGTDMFTEHPVFVSDKLIPWRIYDWEPRVVGVPFINSPLCTNYGNIRVTNVVDSVLDTMQYNKDSEHIMHALQFIVDDNKLYSDVKHEAEIRGITDLLEWEVKEMYEYFNY